MTTLETNRNYEEIERPYNAYLERTDLGAVTSSASTDSMASSIINDNTQTSNSGSTEVDGAVNNGSVETMPVKSDGGLGDLWITNLIRSTSWKPKKVGFYIDGQTGYAEFTNVYVSGNIQALTGTIGGWTINATNLSATGIILDSANQRITVGSAVPQITIDGIAKSISSSNYVSGVFGAGFYLDSNLLEVGNIAARGLIRSATFQKSVVSAVGGSLAVLDADVLDEDMNSLD